MAQWTRAGPTTQRSVDRNYLLLIFFQEFRRENRLKQLPHKKKQERNRRHSHHTASEEPQYQADSSHKILRPAGWRSGSVLGP